MHAERLKMNKKSGKASAKHAWLEFKGVPFLYTPYISFPLDNRRLSGFLPPTWGSTGRSGFGIHIPYYWNIAPNHDALFWGRYLSKRGFVFGSVIAYELGAAFLPIRKAGKLPSKTIGKSYELEYGEDQLEIHTDTLRESDRVLLIDDLIATGGTAEAAIRLIRHEKARVVESCFIIDLPDLKGSQRINNMGCPCYSLCQFEGE
jgi:adenine phosphoribosyltransferase